MSTRSVTIDGLDVAFLEAGPLKGPLALCLHGFPDTAHTWRHLLPVLGDAGFHAVAPYSRGYRPTGVPSDRCYQTGALASDAIALHRALSGDSDAVVIGHDWGALAAYGAAGLAPEGWRRVVAMSVPPMPASAAGFLSYPQLKRSFYVYFLQLDLADMVVPTNDFEFLTSLWRDWSPGYDPGTDLAEVRRSLGEPERVAAALGYYRAVFNPSRRQPRYEAAQAAADGIAPQPTLYLHGLDDGCMGVEMVDGLQSLLPAGSLVHVVERAGHFLHLEQPDHVNRQVIDFLTS